MALEKKILKRSEMDPEYCWNLKDLYESEEAWNKDLENIETKAKKLASFRGHLGESAQYLYDFMVRDEDLHTDITKLGSYTAMKLDEDTGNSGSIAMQGAFMSALTEIHSMLSFAVPELLAVPEDKIEMFMKEKPELEKYRRGLEMHQQMKGHVLSENEEKLLAEAGEIAHLPAGVFTTFTNADLKFPKVKDSQGQEYTLTNGSYIPLMGSNDRVLRENAFKAFYQTYKEYNNTLAAIYSGQVKADWFQARAHHYESSRQASLMQVEVPESVYDSLIEAVHEFLPDMHRYMDLRKKALKLDEMHMYDLYVSMLPQADKEISFEKAKEEVLESVQVYGEEYCSAMKEAFANRWIDVYENEGKRNGAYSMGTPVHPFVLLNHSDNLDAEFTLAHEMGHAMHSYFSNKYQPAVYSEYVLFVAEVASTCNESLLMQHLLKQTEDKVQRAILINYFLDQYRTTVFRQTMFAEFEYQAHRMSQEGKTLTKDVLNQIYYDLNVKYYGSSMISDPEIAYEWSRIPHFYRNFYVYQYATGFSAAMALSDKILNGGQAAVDAYFSFLKGGCSRTPVELLKAAGVDISTPEPVKAALKQFGHLIDELESLMEEI